MRIADGSVKVSKIFIRGEGHGIVGTVAYPGILFKGGSTNSVEDRGQRERGSGGVVAP